MNYLFATTKQGHSKLDLFNHLILCLIIEFDGDVSVFFFFFEELVE